MSHERRTRAAGAALSALMTLAPMAASADATLGTLDDFEGAHTWEGHVQDTPCTPCPAPPFLCLCPPASSEPGVTTEAGGPASPLDMFLRVSELPSFPVVTWNVAADRTGDYASAGIDRIDAHLQNFGPEDLEVRAGVQRGATRWVTSDAEAVQLVGASGWVADFFRLDESDMVKVAGSGSLEFVLAGVDEVRIFHATSEKWTGDGGPDLGIDNVVLPEPGAAAGLGAGAALLLALARRRP